MIDILVKTGLTSALIAVLICTLALVNLGIYSEYQDTINAILGYSFALFGGAGVFTLVIGLIAFIWKEI